MEKKYFNTSYMSKSTLYAETKQKSITSDISARKRQRWNQTVKFMHVTFHITLTLPHSLSRGTF